MADNLAEVAQGLEQRLYGTPEDSGNTEQTEGEQPEDEETEVTETEGKIEGDDALQTEEVETEAASEDEDAQSQDEESDETPQTWTLDELAESLGKEAKISLPNGQTVEVGQLAAGHLRQDDYTRKTQETAELQKSVKAEIEAGRAQVAQTLEQLSGLMNVAEQSLLSEYNAVNWKELEADDPGQAALLKQRFGEKARALEGVKAQAGSQQQQLMVQRHQELQQQWNTQRSECNRVLTQESEAFRKDAGGYLADMSKYALSLGFTEDEISPRIENGVEVYPGCIDPRTFLLLEKAKAYDELKAAPARKRVKKVMKTLKPKGSAETVASTQQRQTMAKFKKSGKPQDMADALLQSSSLFKQRGA